MSESAHTTPTILLVEDDPCLRETTVDLLGFSGARVHAAVSGREASRFLEANHVDLVITDLSMPDGDGNWLIRWVRASPRHRHLKVVIISAHAHHASIEAGIDAGADGYLVKPFDPEKFLTAVGEYLAAAGSRPPPADA